MTLDEAIKHCEEKVKELRTEAEHEKQNQLNKVKMFNEHFPADYTKANKCLECAAEHQQLAEWLKELKALNENKGECDNCKHFKKSLCENSNWGWCSIRRVTQDGDLETQVPKDYYCSWFEKDGGEE